MDINLMEMKACFDFFYDHANKDPESPGYGLVSDGTARPEMASIASVGYALAGWVIGVERGWMDRGEALRLTRGTLATFRDRVPHDRGFFRHFVNLRTAEVYRRCEYSTIDTTLFLDGALTAASYFADSACDSLLEDIVARIDWEAYTFERLGKKTFRMAYNPTEGGDYRPRSGDPWIYHWHMYAEQLSMYVLAAGSRRTDPDLARALYLGFERRRGSYGGHTYVYSPSNGLFVYQFSHAFVAFRDLVAPDDVDWWENSVEATLGNRAWCRDHAGTFPTLSEWQWGLTACLTPRGYHGQGVAPHDNADGQAECLNVFPPCGPAGSAPFAPEIVRETLARAYENHPGAWGRYGFTDGMERLPDGTYWYCQHCIGIDKGISLLMLDNADRGTTWTWYNRHPLVRRGLAVLGFTPKAV